MHSQIIRDFLDWLDSHDLDHDVIKTEESDHVDMRIYVNFPTGDYVRVSDFTENGQCYVRDNGLVSWMSLFEVTELILEYANK